MRHYLGMSLRSVERQKIMSVLTVIAVCLSVTMVLSLIIINDSIMRTEFMQAEKTSGSHHANIDKLTEEQATKIITDDRAKKYGYVSDAGNANIKGLNVTLLGVDENAADLLRLNLIAGEYPSASGEIMLEKRLVENMGLPLSVPQTVSFPVTTYNGGNTAVEKNETFTLAGILENHPTGAAIPRGWCSTEQKSESNNGVHLIVRFKDGINIYETVNEIAESLGLTDENILMNESLLNALGESESVMDEKTLTSIAIGGMVLILACFVIMNIFNVSVTQRKKQFAMLRCTGATVGQIRLIVLAESVILSAVGIAAGLLIGVFASKGIVGAVGSSISPSVFGVETTAEVSALLQSQANPSLTAVLLSIAIGLIITLFSALLPSFAASRTSPVYALSNAVPPVKMKRRRKAERIGNVLWYSAKLNLSRNKRRTVFTVMTLTISIILFIAISSYAAMIDPATAIANMMEGDFTIGLDALYVMPLEIQTYLSDSDIETILALSGVERIKKRSSVLNFVDEDTPNLQVIAYDNATLRKLLDELGENAPTIDEMESRDICLVRDKSEFFASHELEYTAPVLNEYETVFGQELRIAGTPADSETGIQTTAVDVIVTEKHLHEMTGRNDIQQANIFLSDDATPEQIKNIKDTLKAMQSGNQALVLKDFAEVKAELDSMANSIKGLAYGLVAVPGIIGILGIVNTLYTSIHTRMAELGTNRAVGETKGQITASIMFEGIQYGIRAILIGVPLGILMSDYIISMMFEQNNFTAAVIPAISAAACVVTACVTAAVLPLRRIMKMSIVESIGKID
jgi:putative ABC transport system permease protein